MTDGGERETAIDRVARRTGELTSYLFFACMLIIAWEVAARYGFNAPTIWAHDLTIALCSVGFLLSGLYTMQRRAHIRISLLYDKFAPRTRRVVDAVNGAIILVFLGLLGYRSAIDARKSLAIMEDAGTASQIPLPAIAKTAIFIACLLMFLLAASQWRRGLRGGGAARSPAR